ncbi:uncharacterized protein VTP21DRAFT_10149 [Calcarisporiella thermophila]|uniref:uncharacterized protein n=1 Tax=Calcarisporiella thermophila TaxID=911321 RepID=UPI003743C46A
MANLIRRNPFLTLSNLKELIFYVVILRILRRTGMQLWNRGVVGSIRELYTDLYKRVFRWILRLPTVQRMVRQKMQGFITDIERQIAPRHKGGERHLRLPENGMTEDQVLQELTRYYEMGKHEWEEGRVSGAVYHGEKSIIELSTAAYRMFTFSNPLHPDLFPGLTKMEAEVVAMCLSLFNAPEGAAGTTTSGGTESLLMACKAYRDMAYDLRGVTEPEIVVPDTIHAAFDKACAYFRIKLIKVPLDKRTYKVDIRAVRRAINRNTIMLAGSAPNFPHGIIDDIPALAALAKRHGIGMHVDCCLGGFVMPFLERAGFPTEPFDFRVDGVTSISCDTHKYGFAPKGSSVIMYVSNTYRRYQYFCAPDWTGGVYASPAIAGSRPGALIAGCWAALMVMGESGYIEATRKMVTSAKRIEAGIRNIDELFVYGEPKATVVAFGVRDEPMAIYAVADRLTKRGWHLNMTQSPPAAHIACTLLTTEEAADNLLEDLRSVLEYLRANPEEKSKAMNAGVYGASASLPDKSLLSEGAFAFLDAMYMA